MKATFVLCINNSHNQPSFIWCFIAVPSGEFIFFYRRMSVLSHFSFGFMKKNYFCYFTVFEQVSSAVLCLSYNFHAVSHISVTYRYSLERWPIKFENDRSSRLTNLLRSKPFNSKVSMHMNCASSLIWEETCLAFSIELETPLAATGNDIVLWYNTSFKPQFVFFPHVFSADIFLFSLFWSTWTELFIILCGRVFLKGEYCSYLNLKFPYLETK